MGQVFHYAKQGITFTEHRYSAHGKETERENERRKRERQKERVRERASGKLETCFQKGREREGLRIP